MSALLLKDMFLLRRRSGVMVLAIAIFILLAGVQGGLVNTVMAVMMPLMLGFTTMAYDQNDGWDAFACVLPFSRKQLVQSKYLLALISILVSMILVFLVALIASVLDVQTMIMHAGTQFLFGAFFVSINYPLILKFGFEKSRLYYIVVMVALMSIGAALSTLGETMVVPAFLTFVLPLSAIGCLIFSYFVSCSVMNSKEFSGS